MADVMVRKCSACPDPIEIDTRNVFGVVYYQKRYYHLECFCKVATKRSQRKSKAASEWKRALDNIQELEADTKKMIEAPLIPHRRTDELNDWILAHYDVTSLPGYFWNLVYDLEKGIFHKKKCKPIAIEVLTATWKWGQRKLDEINVRNKASNKGPKNDAERVNYDLSIVVGHVADYIKYTNKIKSAEIERENKRKEEIKVDYNKIKTSCNNTNGLDDISELLDDLI